MELVEGGLRWKRMNVRAIETRGRCALTLTERRLRSMKSILLGPRSCALYSDGTIAVTTTRGTPSFCACFDAASIARLSLTAGRERGQS